MFEQWHANRTAVVTGGTTGIGREIARVLAQRGARIVIGARSAGDATVRREILEEIPGALMLPLDVSDPGSFSAFMQAVVRDAGAPGILVNSAGISTHQMVSTHDDDGWQAVIDTNLTGAFRMSRACLGAMISNGWGRIVNIASTAARTAKADYGAYCASKSGLVGLTRAIALEGAPHGVTCTAVSPTWVETPMLTATSAEMAEKTGQSPSDILQRIAHASPQQRIVQPSEIAHLVSLLCSDLCPGLTMEDIQINAGADW